MNEISIERVDVIKDLGVLLDEKMNFKNHMNFIINKAKSILAWVKRYSYEFDDPWVIKRIYETFVLPIIEYASQVWSPKFVCDIKKIESIQKQFLIYALRKFKWNRDNNYRLPPYKHRLLFFHMNTIEDRRKINQILFIITLMNGKLSSPNLLKELKIRVRNNELSIRLRQRDKTNNHFFSENIRDIDTPLVIMKRIFNEYYDLFDFNQSNALIKKNLKNYFALNVHTG